MEIKAFQEKQFAKSVAASRRKYYISAGHRGKGTGASGYGVDEGLEAIFLRDKVAQSIRTTNRIVVTDDDKAQLSAVVKAINTSCNPDDISLDIHFNAAGAAATGVECFVREGARVTEKLVAIELCRLISNTLGIKNRGVKTDNQGQHSKLAMCSDIRCNAVLLEVCFLSNQGDVAKYKEHRMEVVRNIIDALTKNYGT